MKFNLLEIKNNPDPELINLLEKTIYGTPGKGILYRHERVREKVRQISNSNFVSIVRNNSIMGSACFCKRECAICMDEEKIDAFYIRFFTFKSGFRSKIGRSILKPITKGNSIIKKEINGLFLGNGGLGVANKKQCYYAFIEAKNERSSFLSENFGFNVEREFTTRVFSRFLPKKSRWVNQIESFEKSEVINILNNYYKNYNFLIHDCLFLDENYFLLKNKRNEIIAGVQANPEHWKIKEMPGLEGFFILKIFPYLPILNGLFNPNFKFLSFESIFVKPGYENRLNELFASVLAIKKVKVAMIWMDRQSGLKKDLEKVKFGLLNKFAKDKNGLVMIRSNNLSSSQKDTLIKNPIFISGFDLT